MTATLKVNSNGQPRKTLASQLDRLDGILDGLDAALAGAVQEAVGQAVKEAVRTVLTEVLTNRDLQEQLHKVSTDAEADEQSSAPRSLSGRLWETAAQGVRQTVQTVKKAGRHVGLALLAAGGVAVGVAYAARRRLTSAGAALYQGGKRLLGGVVSSLTGVLPRFTFGMI